jgi:hypothetical protein
MNTDTKAVELAKELLLEKGYEIKHPDGTLEVRNEYLGMIYEPIELSSEVKSMIEFITQQQKDLDIWILKNIGHSTIKD